MLGQLARIAREAVIVEVASKYGLLFQLETEGFSPTVETIRQVVTTGTTPPAKPVNGSVIYSCFSSSELREALRAAGLRVLRLIGFGIADTLSSSLGRTFSSSESVEIETMLQDRPEVVDAFPDLLALCTAHES